MSVACTIRAVLLMTLMPDADSREVLTTLLGELIAVPWRRPHAVPSATVLSTWRAAIGEAPVQQLQRELLAAVVAEHRDPALPRVEVGGGLRLGAIDGTVTRMPDTAANRAAFGTAGRPRPATRRSVTCTSPTRSPGPPWPWCAARPAGTRPVGTRARPNRRCWTGCWPSSPQVFGPDRLWIMDRNFPGVPRIAALLATGSHVLVRVKSDIRLPRIGPFAADGSYLTRLSGGGTSLTMRVVEYHVDPGRGDHTRAVLPGHRSARPHHPPGAPARAGLPVALGRLGDRAARGQVGHPRRRTRHRGDPALDHPGADPPGARRLDRRHRARPRRHPLRRRHRRALPQGPPHRAARRRPAPVVHHRPPHPDHHRAGRRPPPPRCPHPPGPPPTSAPWP